MTFGLLFHLYFFMLLRGQPYQIERGAMIELTLEQRQAVAQQGEIPPRAVDPDTQTTYVLIREEVYAQVKALLEEEEGRQFLRDMYPSVMEVFGREGWEDPAMDIYNDLDPRRQP
jgi:hypothetical protein